MQYIRTYQEAERNAAARMQELGFVDAEVTAAGADGGVDIRATTALAQVKWRGAAVSRNEVQKLFGARGSAFYKRLLFFAASEYSMHAIAYADEHRIALFIYEPNGALVPRNHTAAELTSARRSLTTNPRSASGISTACNAAAHPNANLRELKRIRSGDIYKAGHLAAVIARTDDGGTEFRYTPEYLQCPKDPIASTLPVGNAPVHVPRGSVPTFFAGLLPEGHRLALLRRAVETSAEDELSILLAVGADMPGDIQVFPTGCAPVDVPSLMECTAIGQAAFDRCVEVVDPHSIPGVQNKASASMISTPIVAGFGRFILKLSQSGYPHLIENEAAHLAAARTLKLAVTDSDLVHDRSGQPGLLVRRFDRVLDGDTWRRLAFEDATQVLGLPPSAKYNVDSVQVVEALAGTVRAPLLAARNLYLQFLFAWLTGNGDLHGKNIGVLQDSLGRWAIAPIYDIPCTLVYDDDSMALPIVGRTKNLRAKHWAEFAAEIGLPTKAAKSAQQLALRAASTVDLDQLRFTGSPLNRTRRELRLRRGELEHTLDS
ncbi:HipA domain-containing protein [Nocardia sp. FBN12]|uniref:HipA domain-containing protein n=1 Tax=Nocardia sp. FBN12 TaxID=3419766 RepID=UPI003CFEAE4A